MAYALVIRPAWDNTTNDLNRWAAHVVSALQISQRTVDDLAKTQAVRRAVDVALPNVEQLIVFYGHGEFDKLKGHRSHKHEEILLDSQNMHYLRDKIIVAVACDSRATLGVDAVRNAGARAYLGYDERFLYLVSDQVVEADFMRCANAAALAIVSGLSVADAYGNTMQEFDRAILHYARGTGSTHIDAFNIFTSLFWDRGHFGYEGDGLATLL
jgi:hypothetical protein